MYRYALYEIPELATWISECLKRCAPLDAQSLYTMSLKCETVMSEEEAIQRDFDMKIKAMKSAGFL
jgi:hypothetical protein